MKSIVFVGGPDSRRLVHALMAVATLWIVTHGRSITASVLYEDGAIAVEVRAPRSTARQVLARARQMTRNLHAYASVREMATA